MICSPDALINLLGKIRRQEDREQVINKGTASLFEKSRTECLAPLLDALERTESLKCLRDVAVRSRFKEESGRDNMLIVQDLYDDPAITPECYAQVLDNLESTSNHDTFYFLLKNADQGDLHELRKRTYHANKHRSFDFGMLVDRRRRPQIFDDVKPRDA